MARTPPVRTILTAQRNRTIDYLRIDLPDVFIVQPEPFHCARPVVFNKDIALFGKFIDDFACFFLLQVHQNTFLVAGE